MDRHVHTAGRQAQVGPPRKRPLADRMVDAANWRLVRLEATDPEHGTITICLLRDTTWVKATRAEPRQRRRLALTEMGVHAWADVCSVEPCPPEAAGSLAGLVTGTFQTEKATLVSVYVDSLTKPIGATASHPFYSVDRNTWVSAGDLRTGDRVRTSEGEATISQVETRATVQTVYNLEVQGTHMYFVSNAKVWVHNACVEPGPAAWRRLQKSPNNTARLSPGEISARFHSLKKGAGLGPRDSTLVDDITGDLFNNTVRSDEFGEFIGNILGR